MDHDADLAQREAHRPRGRLVADFIDDLDLEEMVPGAESAALVIAAIQGAGADIIGLGAAEAALGFGVLDVAGGGQAAMFEVTEALAHQPPQLLGVEAVCAALADPGGDVAEKSVHESIEPRLDIVQGEAGGIRRTPQLMS